jgi:hypothetical protein
VPGDDLAGQEITGHAAAGQRAAPRGPGVTGRWLAIFGACHWERS